MSGLEGKVEKALVLVESGHAILEEHVENQRLWNETFLKEQVKTHAAVDEVKKVVDIHERDIAWLKDAEKAREKRAHDAKKTTLGAVIAAALAAFSWALTKVWP